MRSQPVGPQPVGSPEPVRVSTDSHGYPSTVYLKSQRVEVKEVRDRWSVPDPEQETQRHYYLVVLIDDRLLNLFYCPDHQTWYRQRISQKSWQHRGSQGKW